MRAFHELPEHVLHGIIAATIDSTRSVGWLFSLRLVNHCFNEAVLHVFFLRKGFMAVMRGHSVDCISPCEFQFCRKHLASRPKGIYAARFTLQRLLAKRDLSVEATHAHQLLQQWEAALAMLKRVDALKRLKPDQVAFYSTCSGNSIFNDIHSAILSEAIDSYLGPEFLIWLLQGIWNLRLPNQYQLHPPTFWVALSACVLGNLDMFKAYTSRLIQPVENSLSTRTPETLIVKQPMVLLTVAIKHARSCIVNYLLQQRPNLMSEFQTDHAPLQAAIFSNNNDMLQALLNYTPKLPDLLANALIRYRKLLPRSSSGSETIRLLTRHFSPLSPEARAWLIVHSCAVGDVMLLEEFSEAESLFNHPIHDVGGQIPTYVNFAIRYGNVDTLRFLLNHGILESKRGNRVRIPMAQALSFNQIDCYRELYPRFDDPEPAMLFEELGLAENTEGLMSECISRYGDILFSPMGDDPDNPQLSVAQKALFNAIQRLRPGNVQFLLGAGVRPFPGQRPMGSWHTADPLEIKWSYFQRNQNAFVHTQMVLDAFDLPKLKVAV